MTTWSLSKAGAMGRPRTRGFTILEIMIVVLVIGILATIAIPFFARARERSWSQACQENRAKIAQAKQLWAIENGKDPTDTPVWDDLVPKYLKTEPGCPLHGLYTIGRCNQEPACSVHGS